MVQLRDINADFLRVHVWIRERHCDHERKAYELTSPKAQLIPQLIINYKLKVRDLRRFTNWST